jgi:putative mRNA 3-end processing factor
MAAGNRDSLIIPTDHGLYCPAGDFHIDPWRSDPPVERAIVTHAHADHLRPGHRRYLCSRSGEAVLRQRVHPGAAVQTLPWGEAIDVGDVRVSLHPAGHLLGSAQVRVERNGEVWVVTGDYKTQHDRSLPADEKFEVVNCHTFITESTFGLPIYRWPPQKRVFSGIDAWWRRNIDAGRASVIFAYALGKAQRVLAGLDDSIGPIIVHGAVKRFVDIYREAGIALPRTQMVSEVDRRQIRGRAMVVAPPSADGTPWLRRFGPISTAFASGWMQVRGMRRRRSMDRGFVLSDHVDWPALMSTIDATGADRIGVTHGYTAAVVRYLREVKGRDAFVVPTRYEGEAGGEDAGDAAGNAQDTAEGVDA